MKNAKTILRSNRGESLIESLISIVIFSLLIATITVTIATALRITAQATEDAEQAQRIVNQIIAWESEEITTDADIVTFTLNYEIVDKNGIPIITENEREPIKASHEVKTTEHEGKRAFWPSPDVPEG